MAILGAASSGKEGRRSEGRNRGMKLIREVVEVRFELARKLLDSKDARGPFPCAAAVARMAGEALLRRCRVYVFSDTI